MAERQTGLLIRAVRSDRDGEFFCKELQEHFAAVESIDSSWQRLFHIKMG